MLTFERLPDIALWVSLGASVALPALCWAPPVLAQGPRQEQTLRSGQVALPGPSDDLLAKLETIYKDIHANPELSMQERRTAGIAAEWLREQGYEVTEGVGGTGVVGLLRNGEGPTVLLRADMDALPMKENTGLPYASTKTGTDPSSGRETGIAHSCGHDMHVTWLIGATQILAANRDKWRGTVMAVFQPGGGDRRRGSRDGRGRADEAVPETDRGSGPTCAAAPGWPDGAFAAASCCPRATACG